MSEQEELLLELYRKVRPAVREHIINMLELFIKEQGAYEEQDQ